MTQKKRNHFWASVILVLLGLIGVFASYNFLKISIEKLYFRFGVYDPYAQSIITLIVVVVLFLAMGISLRKTIKKLLGR